MPSADGKPLMLIVGAGAVSQVFVPLLMKDLDWPWERIVFLDAAEGQKARLPAELMQKARFVVATLNAENHGQVLGEIVGKGDMLVNLSILHSLDVLMWCLNNGVRYLDTSREEWHSDERVTRADRADRSKLSLYEMHFRTLTRVNEFLEAHKGEPIPTAVLCHGMNPGLVSHFAKMGLRDIARKIVAEKPDDARVPKLEAALKDGNFAAMAQLTGVKVIHISERDTQISTRPKEVDEFVNTWSIPGFMEETCMYSEIAWGTHEKLVPTDAQFWDYGERNMACLATKGGKTRARSWVPSGPTMGYVMPHDECFTMSRYLTVRNAAGEVEYRPSVYFVYQPSDLALASLHEFEQLGWTEQSKRCILTDKEIVSGRDEVGVLLLGHDYGAWWVGSRLSIDDARRHAPGNNATVLQVACAVLGAVKWMIAHPHEGVHYPETLPTDEIIAVARPWMEPVVSVQSGWSPLNPRTPLSLFDHNETFGPIVADDENAPCYPTKDDEWCFPIFLTQPMSVKRRE